MAIIDYTYFISEITVAQRSQPEVLEDLNYKIDKYELNFLRKFFGVKMTKEFLDGLDNNVAKWEALRDGGYYDNDSKFWMGFANDAKESIIANYIYFYYNRDLFLQTSGSGAALPQDENATHVYPIHKQVRSWNEMVDWIVSLHEYLTFNDFEGYKLRGATWDCGCEPNYFFRKINQLNL